MFFLYIPIVFEFLLVVEPVNLFHKSPENLAVPLSSFHCRIKLSITRFLCVISISIKLQQTR